MRSVTTTGRLLGARQLATVVERLADRQTEWLTRVRLNPAGRWYEQIHLDDSHEIWLISWLPGQETGFHDHGGASGAFTVALGTLLESRPAGGSGRHPLVRSPLHPQRAQRVGRVGGGQRARVLTADVGDDALRADPVG